MKPSKKLVIIPLAIIVLASIAIFVVLRGNSKNMESILVVAYESSAATSQIKAASNELEKMSVELLKKIGFFKV